MTEEQFKKLEDRITKLESDYKEKMTTTQSVLKLLTQFKDKADSDIKTIKKKLNLS